MTDGVLRPSERHTLGALRYAVNDESASYLAIMRLFTTGMSGFLSDQSADEVAERLADQGLVLDRDTVDQRLSYLVEHGNLARSPRETEARSLREYLSNRARYQLTARGELVQRHVDELLDHTDRAQEVSSEMLPGILAGMEGLAALAGRGLDEADPGDVAGRITTLFAQFEVLVTSTRQFYSYLNQVLTRFDLGRDEFVLFKGALIDYLQRFVEEISRHLPQVADRLRDLEPRIPDLCTRANVGERLVGLDGQQARRATGLEPRDWQSLHVWFVGSPGRRCDAENVRRLATDAMRSLLTNLRRIAAGADRQQSRYGDLVRLAGWFDRADDVLADELWAAVFGLFSARHLSFAADGESDPVPATTSWWQAPAADVPVGLRVHGQRKVGGRTGARVDYSAVKRARLQEREQRQRRREQAIHELASHAGRLREVRVSDDARAAFLELYAQALARHNRPLAPGATTWGDARLDGLTLRLELRQVPGDAVVLRSPAGALQLNDLAVELSASGAQVHPAANPDDAPDRRVRA